LIDSTDADDGSRVQLVLVATRHLVRRHYGRVALNDVDGRANHGTKY